MSPAGMPCAFTVTEPSPDPLGLHRDLTVAGTAGAGSEADARAAGPDGYHDHAVTELVELRVGAGYPG